MQLKTETKVGIFVLISIGIFAYMAVQLGVFRFHIRNYKPYYIYFDDLNGLQKKSDVKIAGVKVGWVDESTLVQNGVKAKVKVMIQGQYSLYSDSDAQIHQDGFLGAKYLEIIPGSPGLTKLPEGATLSKSVKQMASIDDLMTKFDNIARNIEDVTASLKGAIGTQEQQVQIKSIVTNIGDASHKIAIFADALARNERVIDGILNDIKAFSHDISPIGRDIHRVAERLDSNIDRLSNQFDSTMRHVNSIAEKIDKGKGFLGKIINEDQVYDDIQVVAKGIRDMTEVADNMGLVFDTHFEAMQRDAEHYNHEDSKGYFDIRLHTNEDTFYMFQLVGDEKGSIKRTSSRNQYFSETGIPLTTEDIGKLPNTFNFPPFRTDNETITRNTTKFGLQIGKIYKDVALRFGIFENTVGAAVDYEIPFCSDKFRWVTSFEAFDFRGQQRLNDRRPHLKWINRLFLMRNIYFNFGADDFISKKNANAFFGLGIRFSDDDIKFLLSKVGFLASGFGLMS